MAWLCKFEQLSAAPRAQRTWMDAELPTYSPSSGKVEEEDLWVLLLSQASQICQFQVW